jgi:hypothetical protein
MNGKECGRKVRQSAVLALYVFEGLKKKYENLKLIWYSGLPECE